MAGQADAGLSVGGYSEQLLAELNRMLEQRSGYSPRMISGMMYMIGLVMIVTGNFAASGGNAMQFPPLQFIGWTVLCIALLACMEWRSRTYGEHIRQRMDQSDFIHRVAIGHGQLPDIRRYVAWPWILFLGPAPVSLKDWVRLYASELDWYLAEPRHLLRMRWLASMASFAMMLAMLGFVLYQTGLFGGNASVLTAWAQLTPYVMAFAVLGILGSYDVGQRLLNIRLLRDELAKL
ncbi:hypothetical protein KDL29_01635 [bacterium]|nr:hypothetical protein [bacterium]